MISFKNIRKTSDTKNNLILSKNVKINLDKSTSNNNNTLVCGCGGTGKSFSFIRPNIELANSNYIIIDPLGSLHYDYGNYLKEKGYEVKILNLNNLESSIKYNPFKYIKNNEDLIKIITSLITNWTKEVEEAKSLFEEINDLIISLASYVLECKNNKENVFYEIYNTIKLGYEKIDDIFKNIDNVHFSYYRWQKFKDLVKEYDNETLKNIFNFAETILEVFVESKMQEFTNVDELSLNDFTDDNKKIALFIAISIRNIPRNFLISILLSQVLSILTDESENKNLLNRKTQTHIILDDFIHIGYIHDIDMYLTKSKKYKVNIFILIQAMKQLKMLYKDTYKTIISNCSNLLFLGSRELDMLEYIKSKMGNKTIDNKTGLFKHKSAQKGVMTYSDILSMSADNCIVFIDNYRTILDKKYKIKNIYNKTKKSL